jgi:hypothetical protein
MSFSEQSADQEQWMEYYRNKTWPFFLIKMIGILVPATAIERTHNQVVAGEGVTNTRNDS